MRNHLLTHATSYAALAAVAFRLGWWACNYVSDRMDKFDPRIGEGKYGW